MSPRSIIVSALVVSLVIVVFVVPEIGLKRSASALAAGPCMAAEPSPPNADTLAAIARLDRLSGFPLTGGRARTAAREAASACLNAYANRCDVFRDGAVDQAHEAMRARLLEDTDNAPTEADTDWRTHVDRDATAPFCDGWNGWRAWLSEQGLDAEAACPVCALPAPAAVVPAPAPVAPARPEALEPPPADLPGQTPPSGNPEELPEDGSGQVDLPDYVNDEVDNIEPGSLPDGP